METKKLSYPKRLTIALVALFAAGWSADSAVGGIGSRTRPPNVILVLADDMGLGDLASLNGNLSHTPHLDGLIKNSIWFNQAYSASPVCAPARAALLTGRYAHSTGAVTLNMERFPEMSRIRKDETTLADLFRANGYATGLIGKWHSGMGPDYHPLQRGFDEFAGFVDYLWVPSYFKYSLDIQGQKVSFSDRYLTDDLSQRAIAFVRRHREHPFFLHLAHYAPHRPLGAPEDHIAPFLDKGLDRETATVYAMIEIMDEGIGRLMAELERLGISEHTLVIFASDNGPDPLVPKRFNRGMRGSKYTVYEGGIHVPFLMHWPGRLTPGRRDQVIHFTDVLPTLAELCQLNLPTGLQLDGQCLVPLLEGDADWKAPVRFWQWNRAVPRYSHNAAVRDGHWKLVRPYVTRSIPKAESKRAPTLYDLKTDPAEANDLSHQYPERMARMTRALDAWSQAVEKDRTRAHAGTKRWNNVPGVVLDHSPKASGIYLGSPGLAVLPDGTYVAKADEFGPASPKDERGGTRIYRSQDRGRTWTRINRINGAFWASIFVHRDDLYLMGTNKAYGDAVVLKSRDGGSTWSTPTDRDHGLILTDARYHCAPVPVVIHEGRIWRAMEDAMGYPRRWGAHFRAFMMSAPVHADLLKANSWILSTPLPRHADWLDSEFGGWLEGNAVVAPQGRVVNMLRVDYRDGGGKAAMIHVNDDGKRSWFDPEKDIIDFPGGCKKFTIRLDAQTQRYWALTNWIAPQDAGGNPERTRNTVALIVSPDLRQWDIRCVVLHHPDVAKHGFQYLDWLFEGDDLIALSRTAFDDGQGGADNQHNANFITFHRFENFRQLSLADSVVNVFSKDH